MNVNFHGVVNTVHTFLPSMKSSPGLIVNTGSKQGITTPPGSGAAYNISKASVKVFTEQLAYELRQDKSSQIAVHLLIPGWVHTGLTGAKSGKAKPDGAWSAEQTAEFALQRIQKGSFYILCPDNETSADVDKARMEVSPAARNRLRRTSTELIHYSSHSGTSTISFRIDQRCPDGTMTTRPSSVSWSNADADSRFRLSTDTRLRNTLPTAEFMKAKGL